MCVERGKLVWVAQPSQRKTLHQKQFTFTESPSSNGGAFFVTLVT
ncbi:hypothetical protein MED217_01455 [Leeuwenhoekiella blandensis MED217]|uniref:Uncharacterized protein n=1 Tax=Leeuwenhoekiella blandensis (strain CECT 7118 / CCUG 51940 / KCTC 22103 / MED217) TaxID=398720 RepID=A3XL04_LEEBM|nr:hypothetical protein MED217_01455 [Leeuwenhoekiella blandensis MED217]